jgi:hypothetical protein
VVRRRACRSAGRRRVLRTVSAGLVSRRGRFRVTHIDEDWCRAPGDYADLFARAVRFSST